MGEVRLLKKEFEQRAEHLIKIFAEIPNQEKPGIVIRHIVYDLGERGKQEEDDLQCYEEHKEKIENVYPWFWINWTDEDKEYPELGLKAEEFLDEFLKLPIDERATLIEALLKIEVYKFFRMAVADIDEEDSEWFLELAMRENTRRRQILSSLSSEQKLLQAITGDYIYSLPICYARG
jgi:hypothetical protein